MSPVALPAVGSGPSANSSGRSASWRRPSATIVLGIISLWAEGATLGLVLATPAATPANPGLSRALVGLHGFGANLVLILTAVHLVAALAHHYLWRNGLLYRVHPPRRQQW
jgi:cytochrome b561